MTPIYQVSAADLQAIVTQAVAAGIAEFEARSKPVLKVSDLATRYGCSRDTIYSRVKARKLPQPDCGSAWSRNVIERWDNERGTQSLSAN